MINIRKEFFTGNFDVPSPIMMTSIIQKLNLKFLPENVSLRSDGNFRDNKIKRYTINVLLKKAIHNGTENDRIKISSELKGAPRYENI